MAHPPAPTITIEEIPDARPQVQILKLTGSLTVHNYYGFQELTRRKPLPEVLLVDLTAVSHIDSVALGSFVGLHVSCEGNGRKYALIGPNESLRTLFDLTHTTSFLVTFPSRAAAEAKLLP